MVAHPRRRWHDVAIAGAGGFVAVGHGADPDSRCDG
jgi:hypothetical protein